MEQVRIPAENHWDSETLRNTDGPWGIKVSQRSGFTAELGQVVRVKFGGFT